MILMKKIKEDDDYQKAQIKIKDIVIKSYNK